MGLQKILKICGKERVFSFKCSLFLVYWGYQSIWKMCGKGIIRGGGAQLCYLYIVEIENGARRACKGNQGAKGKIKRGQEAQRNEKGAMKIANKEREAKIRKEQGALGKH